MAEPNTALGYYCPTLALSAISIIRMDPAQCPGPKLALGYRKVESPSTSQSVSLWLDYESAVAVGELWGALWSSTAFNAVHAEQASSCHFSMESSM